MRTVTPRLRLQTHETFNWNERDGVPLALIFAQEHGAGLEAPGTIRSRLAAPCEAVEMLCGLRIKPAEGLLLDGPGEKPRDEVLGKGRRRAGAERHAPQVRSSIDSQSDAGRGMLVTPRCDPVCLCAAARFNMSTSSVVSCQLRALPAHTPDPARPRPLVGEGVRSCPRAGCGRSACPVPRLE
jgi:hypothetical protein